MNQLFINLIRTTFPDVKDQKNVIRLLEIAEQSPSTLKLKIDEIINTLKIDDEENKNKDKEDDKHDTK